MATIKTQILLRNDTAANWESNNPVLGAGEVGIEFSTVSGETVKKIKIGDGLTEWNNLEYFAGDEAALEARVAALEAELDPSESGSIAERLAAVEEAVDPSQSGSLAEQVEDLADQLDATDPTSVAGRLGTAEEDIDAIELAAGTLTNRVTQAENDIDALELAAGTLTTRIGQAENDIDALELADQTLSTRIGDAEGNITTLQDSVATLTSKVAGLAGAFKFMGNATKQEIGGVIHLYDATSGDEIVPSAENNGNVYQVSDEEYVSNGTAWVELGYNVDLSGYATVSDLEGISIAGITLGSDKQITVSELSPALGLDTMAASITANAASIATNAGNITALEGRVDTIEEALDPAQAGSLAEQVSDLAGTVGELTTTVADISASVTAIEGSITVMAATIAAQQTAIDGITPTIATLGQTYVPVTRTVAGLSLGADIDVVDLSNALGLGGSLIGEVDTDYFALNAIAGTSPTSYKLTLASNITNTIILDGGNSAN